MVVVPFDVHPRPVYFTWCVRTAREKKYEKTRESVAKFKKRKANEHEKIIVLKTSEPVHVESVVSKNRTIIG